MTVGEKIIGKEEGSIIPHTKFLLQKISLKAQCETFTVICWHEMGKKIHTLCVLLVKIKLVRRQPYCVATYLQQHEQHEHKKS